MSIGVEGVEGVDVHRGAKVVGLELGTLPLSVNRR